jgi:hypothetical protein
MKRRPSEGIRVEASVIARLLGLKLLKLDASVLVFPTEVERLAPARPDLVLRKSRVSPGSPGRAAPSGENGRRTLADAVRSIHEGAELLAEARKGGPSA